MTSIELKSGDRVRLNELGASRSPKIRVRTGVVVAFSGRRSGGASLGILFDGNKRPTTLHRSYVELDERRRANEALALASKRSCADRAAGDLSGNNCFSDFGFGLALYSLADRMTRLVELGLKAKPKG